MLEALPNIRPSSEPAEGSLQSAVRACPWLLPVDALCVARPAICHCGPKVGSPSEGVFRLHTVSCCSFAQSQLHHSPLEMPFWCLLAAVSVFNSRPENPLTVSCHSLSHVICDPTLPPNLDRWVGHNMSLLCTHVRELEQNTCRWMCVHASFCCSSIFFPIFSPPCRISRIKWQAE